MYLIVCNNNRKNIELEIKFCQKLFLCVLYFDVYIEGFVCTTFLMQTDNSYRKIPPIKHHVHFTISILKTYYFKRRFRRNRNTIIKKMESFPTLYSWRSMMSLYRSQPSPPPPPSSSPNILAHLEGPTKQDRPWAYRQKFIVFI